MDTVITYFWEVAALITHRSDYYLFSLLTPMELEFVLLKSFHLNIRAIKKRDKRCMFWRDAGTGNILFHYDPSLLDTIGSTKNLSHDIKELKGTIANTGKARGRVRIVNNISQGKNFN